MSFLLQDLRDEVAALLQDDAKFITPAELDKFIQAATRHLSIDKPYSVVKDVSGNATQEVALPTDYIKGWSDVESVETPIDETPPNYLRRDIDWFVYENPTKTPAMRLRFKESTPAATDTIRITVTSPHTVSAAASTFNAQTFQATTYWTVHLCHNALAAKFNESTDPTIAADTVDYASKAQNALFQAKENKKLYREILGLDEKQRGEQALGDFDMSYPNKEDFIYHPRRER